MSAGLASLRRLTATARRPEERCELCAAPVAAEHQHLVEPENRRLLCCCPACAILFDESGATRYRRVPRDAAALPEFALDDAAWNRLSVPIGLAFFFLSSVSGAVVAIFPSPAGPTEAEIEEDAWRDIAAAHPALAAMRADVEAFLADRTRGARRYWIAPIDRCYQLAGLVRRHWRGFSGGDEFWREADAFLMRLAPQAARHA